MRFYQSALAVFDEIGQQGAAHTYFNQTLSSGSRSLRRSFRSRAIIEKVGRYGVDQLEQFNNSESATFTISSSI